MAMTQDQDGPVQGTGYVVRGEVVPDDGSDESAAERATPMTHFRKVAGSPDAQADHDDTDGTGSEEVGAVSSPQAGDPDDQDDPDWNADLTSATAASTVTTPDDVDHFGIATGPHEATAPDAIAPGVTATSEGTGQHADAPQEPELRPGEAGNALDGFGDLAYGSLLPDASEYRQRWQEVQFRFVDDPHGSVAEAADVIAQVTAKLEAAIAERQRAIAERQRSLRADWSESAHADTETLRATLLTYRMFLDQLTGVKGPGG
jgi:hypothetical protein